MLVCEVLRTDLSDREDRLVRVKSKEILFTCVLKGMRTDRNRETTGGRGKVGQTETSLTQREPDGDRG